MRAAAVALAAMIPVMTPVMIPGLSPASAEILTPSEFVIMMDYESGDILYEKNMDAPMKPASMAKMMTTYMVFQQLKNGSLKMDDKFIVSEKAYRKGGSRMFLELGSQVTVRELLRGVIVQSGNDAAIVIAEGLAGTEDAFAEEMTLRANELGMTNTVFGNSTGWPDERTTTTVRDLAILAQALIREFPEYYKIYSEKTYTYNNIKQPNRNPLLYSMNGADGLKTGHTSESGYGLVGSAEVDGQRLILVINGLNSSKERKLESTRLMQLGFRTFTKYDLLIKDDVIGRAPIWMGVEETVPLVPDTSVSRVLDRKTYAKVATRTNWPDPINAPVKKGQKLGEIFITVDGVETRYPLVAGKDIDKLPLHKRIGAFFKYLIFGAETNPNAK
ncbi:MAG: D-alanyl-D-alanine carboxypeptidase [Alphaproteobacteria bacterium]|nr:D-alanyl-D-alanine carboxypeptidase [Alphaproteobacteria bacterium]